MTKLIIKNLVNYETNSYLSYLSYSVYLLHHAQGSQRVQLSLKNIPDALYGTASYYANKFEGRLTANGEIFSQQKMTAACNVLPLGTWIKVTNLYNGRSVIVKVNDRLHYKIKGWWIFQKLRQKKLVIPVAD